MTIRKSAYKQASDFETAIGIFNAFHAFLGEKTVDVRNEISRIKRRLEESLAQDGFDVQELDVNNPEPISFPASLTEKERAAVVALIKRSIDIVTIIDALEGLVTLACLGDRRLDSEREFRSIRKKFSAVLLSSSLLSAEDKRKVEESFAEEIGV